ncbi:MAG: hypothetical protein HGN29_13370 [Asgard group archaeon]|nr:hypothetical protein [Asgard group archaeon]
MKAMLVFDLLKYFLIKNRKGSPILEEILLIGIAVFIFAIIFVLIWDLIGWSQGQFWEIFS